MADTPMDRLRRWVGLASSMADASHAARMDFLAKLAELAAQAREAACGDSLVETEILQIEMNATAGWPALRHPIPRTEDRTRVERAKTDALLERLGVI